MSHLLWSTESRDVVVLRWPEQADDVDRLDRLGVPRLLLVEPGVAPPEHESCLQDWVRLPAEDADVRVRLRALSHRPARHPVAPSIDTVGQLSHRGQTLFLSPLDQRLAELFISRFGDLVDESEIRDKVWPEGTTTQGIRVQVSRLRRRIAAVGLTITCVRNLGYVMHERSTSPASGVSEGR